MAVPIAPAEKDAILNILRNRDCGAAKDVYANLVNYEDLVFFFMKYGKAFDGDNAYLDSIAILPDDIQMQAVGIYYNKTGPLTITNPKVVIKCTGGITININAGGLYRDLEIVGASDIDDVIITNNTTIDSFTVAGGSTVNNIIIQPGSCILTMLIKSENGQDSTVNKIDGTCVKNFGLSANSTFGGYECDESGGTVCLHEVIGLSSNTPTVDGFTVAWTNPVNSMGNQVTYRQVGNIPWLVPNAFGNATGTFGPGPSFTFHAMASLTSYEVRVQNSCIAPTQFSAGEIVTDTTL